MADEIQAHIRAALHGILQKQAAAQTNVLQGNEKKLALARQRMQPVFTAVRVLKSECQSHPDITFSFDDGPHEPARIIRLEDMDLPSVLIDVPQRSELKICFLPDWSRYYLFKKIWPFSERHGESCESAEECVRKIFEWIGEYLGERRVVAERRR